MTSDPSRCHINCKIGKHKKYKNCREIKKILCTAVRKLREIKHQVILDINVIMQCLKASPTDRECSNAYILPEDRKSKSTEEAESLVSNNTILLPS